MYARVARFHRTGEPCDVVKIEEEALPEMTATSLRVAMRRASINPADINFIQGRYGKKPNLPAVAGLEGVGEVVALGAGVEKWQMGDWVRLPEGSGMWRSEAVVEAASCLSFPKKLSAEQAAMLYVNPATAWRMLHDFVALKPGDWIVQNAANSGVGRCVIQIARRLGFRTVNFVRRVEVAEELRKLGADEVWVEGSLEAKERKPWPARLALNGVGGESALNLLKNLDHGGMHVTYGAMAKQPVTIPNGFLIFNDVQVRGFWVSRWYALADVAKRDGMLLQLADWMEQGYLQLPVEGRYRLTQIQEGLRCALADRRGGKIILELDL
jgi:mitochondrial enoyl-[acyl-carrier protein] reductase / trans-2-enoyl-CoA reductase